MKEAALLLQQKGMMIERKELIDLVAIGERGKNAHISPSQWRVTYAYQGRILEIDVFTPPTQQQEVEHVLKDVEWIALLLERLSYPVETFVAYCTIAPFPYARGNAEWKAKQKARQVRSNAHILDFLGVTEAARAAFTKIVTE